VFESNRLEPLNNGSITRKTGDFSPVFPSLLRGQDIRTYLGGSRDYSWFGFVRGW